MGLKVKIVAFSWSLREFSLINSTNVTLAATG